MATYKKYEGRLITNYRVEIDYYLDDTHPLLMVLI